MWRKYLIYGSIAIALLMTWEYYGTHSDTVRLLVSSPSLSLEYFAEHSSDLLQATGITFYEAITGLLIATAFSFGMMILCFYYPVLMDYVLPVMVTSQVIPLIVLAPFFIILFGIGLISKIAMAALMCFFPIFVNFATGYKGISSSVHELAEIYNASRTFKIFNIYFPLSLPSIFAGLKISATLAVIGAIVAEFNGADIGLGKNLFLSAKRLEPELMITSLFVATLLGFLSYGLIKALEKRFSHL